MPRFNNNRRAFSLIEILAAVMIAATVATIAVTQFRTPGDTAHWRSCQLSRQTVQNEANRYIDITGSLPSSDLRQLSSSQYWDGPLPTCPVTGTAFTLDRSGNINCKSHP
ncbi:type II secretion system protein [Rubripirellula reticaptiva]|uniref:Prepilin-type N-terminal cleavage/methylation domain-containing protein n=1 Tax=Rubripirellula reticaptiva TaxID=2528013 RepID=A0A5C6FDX3_9BACT|nr:prepilin-type N-terminal cleavage/methylation domain-containing protein [Rubripirellula reticaptiva]TWU57761.1 hypothetical protein Poly59_06700 [Rubripirellula reticaptiva]